MAVMMKCKNCSTQLDENKAHVEIEEAFFCRTDLKFRAVSIVVCNECKAAVFRYTTEF